LLAAFGILAHDALVIGIGDRLGPDIFDFAALSVFEAAAVDNRPCVRTVSLYALVRVPLVGTLNKSLFSVAQFID
jgi:hypothetical protein